MCIISLGSGSFLVLDLSVLAVECYDIADVASVIVLNGSINIVSLYVVIFCLDVYYCPLGLPLSIHGIVCTLGEIGQDF